MPLEVCWAQDRDSACTGLWRIGRQYFLVSIAALGRDILTGTQAQEELTIKTSGFGEQLSLLPYNIAKWVLFILPFPVTFPFPPQFIFPSTFLSLGRAILPNGMLNCECISPTQTYMGTSLELHIEVYPLKPLLIPWITHPSVPLRHIVSPSFVLIWRQ